MIVVEEDSVDIIFWSRVSNSSPFALKRLSGDCCASDDKRLNDDLSEIVHLKI